VFASVSHGSRVHSALQAGARWAGPLAGLALVAAVFALHEPNETGTWFNVFWTAGPTTLALLSGVVIGSLVLRPAGLGSRILSHPWLANPGRDLSYAAYLWHLPIYLLLIPLIPSLWLRVPLAAALTVLMAYLSFRFVERPLRRWASTKLDPAVDRSAPEPARVPAPAATH
jgi:peptidoglycan/LPS O-acetylase OafA/YrhL